MSDNVFEILIKFGLSKEKATEAVNELKKIEEQTKNTGKEGVKQEEAVAEATNKTFASKKQLKDMVKSLGHEFPMLGMAGRLALNPIVLVTTAVTAGFALFNRRITELTQSLGGVELPDVTEDQITRVNRLAEAMKKVGDNAGKIKEKLSDSQKAIDASAGFFKALGLDLGTGPDRAKAAEGSAAAAVLSGKGAAHLAAAGAFNPNNKEIDKLALMSGEAEKQIPGVIGRINEIEDLRGRGRWNPMKWWGDTKMGIRYGGVGSYEEMLGMEQSRLVGLRDTVSRYQGVRSNRDRRADLFSSGNAEIAGAASIIEGNLDLRRNIGVQSATAFATATGNLGSGNIATLPNELRDFFKTMIEMQKAVREANIESRNLSRVRAQQQ